MFRPEPELFSLEFSTKSWNRRAVLGWMASSFLVATCSHLRGAETTVRSGLGLVVYCCRFLREELRKKDPSHDLFAPLSFLKHCHSVGAGGMQCQFGILDRSQIAELRSFAEKHDLYLEAIVRLPNDDGDLDRYEKELRTAKQAGALAARTTIIPGRRYEYFDSLKQFRELEKRGEEMLIRGVRAAERTQIPIAVENHKDQRNAARLKLFETISSEFVGACVDTGNSIALLEDPIQTIRDFAPWAHSVHLKDQALQLHDDGFLLGDVPLGQGSLDLLEMVGILRTAKPNVRFSLELITRDPLLVPCLTEKYWATLPDLPAPELARTLRLVRENGSDNGQFISKMSDSERVERETQNVRESLDFARRTLDI